MIIKNLTRTGNGSSGALVRYLFKYMLDDRKTIKSDIYKHELPFVVTHNVRAKSVQGFIAEFDENEKYRIHQRKDKTLCHHTILSWAKTDAARLNDAMLADLAKKYISLRGTNNLFVITKHVDRNHTHLHCAMSGSQLDGFSSRISKDSFAQLKTELDAYQKQRYPDLISLPEHGKAKRQIQSKKIDPIKIIDVRATKKAALLECVERARITAPTMEAFIKEIESAGHAVYYRNGTPAGITFEGNDLKFRFSAIGVDLDSFPPQHLLEKEEALITQKESGDTRMPMEMPIDSISATTEDLGIVHENKLLFDEEMVLNELDELRYGNSKTHDLEEMEHRSVNTEDTHHRRNRLDDFDYER